MLNMYSVGVVYIWQNLKNHPECNGCEVVVIGDAQEIIINGKPEIGQVVDETYQGKKVAAFAGQLRLKDTPSNDAVSGEKGIMEMFKKNGYVKYEEMV